eukprot:4767678-Prorocentrum_lima.AAC.1
MLWNAAVLEPAWAGNRSPTDTTRGPTRQLRRLRQSECLLQALESAIIEAGAYTTWRVYA